MKYLDSLILRIYGYTEHVDIGLCYQYGKHVTQNIETAKQCYLNGAADGDYKAYSLLSNLSKIQGNLVESLYYKGKTLALMRFWECAIDAYEEAAGLNHTDSMYELALLLLSDHEEANYKILKANVDLALNWLRKAAKAGHAAALRLLLTPSSKYRMILAQMHELGEIDKKVNIKAAIMFYEECSNVGNNDATYRLGQLYELGLCGLTIDIPKSFNYYLKAAKSHHQQSLLAMENIVTTTHNVDHVMALANVYFENLKNPVTAADWVKQAIEWGSAKNNAKINTLLEKKSELAYQVALLYVEAKDRSYMQYPYLVIAAKQGHAEALKKLNNDADNKSVDALFYLGKMYVGQAKWEQAIQTFSCSAELNDHSSMKQLANIYAQDRKIDSSNVIKKDIKLRIYWLRKAVSKRNRALEELIELSKSEPAAARALADIYELGVIDGNKDISKVLNNLQLASEQNDIDSSFRLGGIYEYGWNDVAINLKESFNYYYIGAKLKHLESLEALERLIKILNDDLCAYKLGMLYLEQFNNESAALKCFIKLANKGYSVALVCLEALAAKKAVTAFNIAKLYEENIGDPTNACQYYRFYAVAASANHTEALTTLEQASSAGNPDAQFSLGKDYWLVKKETLKAIDCCILAANQQHAAAVNFINSTSFSANEYLHIAKKYEQGEHGEAINIELAISFYEKAVALNNKDAAFSLGQIHLAEYNSDSVYKATDIDKIFNYFLIAAKLGHKDSVVILEDLGQEVSASLKVMLGDIFKNSACRNLKKAEKWFKLAAEEGNVDAVSQLKSLSTQKIATNSSTFFAGTPTQIAVSSRPNGARVICK